MAQNKKRGLLFKWLRAAMAAGLLLFLLRRIGSEQLLLALKSGRPAFIVLLMGLLLIDAVLRSFNWRLLLRARGYSPSLGEVLFNYAAGAFFGAFIPSSLGTDIARAVLIAKRNSIKAADSALAIVMLNLLGLLALAFVGLSGAILLLFIRADSRLPGFLIIICAAILLLFLVLLSGWTPFKKSERAGLAARAAAKLAEFSAALAAFRRQPLVLLKGLALSILSQAAAILIVFVSARALTVDAPLFMLIAIVPAIALCRLVPVSIAGLGGEQAFFVVLFSFAGVSEAQSFLISLLVSFANLAFALFGGCLYIGTAARVIGEKATECESTVSSNSNTSLGDRSS